jgi:hypothetical protein
MCLAALYRQPEAFADVMQWPHDEFRETFLGSIATELHCAAFHQCEALLALRQLQPTGLESSLIQKPFTPIALITAVRGLLDRKARVAS